MTDSWQPVSKFPLKAVAIYNYNVAGTPNGTTDEQDEGSPWHLSFFVGESLMVMEESQHWFYGHSISNAAFFGIFPKTYVSLVGSTSVKPPPPIVHETTAALKEWNTILRQKFLDLDNEKLKLIQDIMREVMTMRSTLVASKMTVEESKETRQKVTTKMDFLNQSLGLDLVVRDSYGLVMTPAKTSAVTLFRHHLSSSDKIKTMMLTKPRDEVEMTNSFRIMLKLNNFVTTKLSESVDLIISIFEYSEGKSPKPLCENFIVENWNRNPSTAEDRTNLRVQFGDISKNDITNKRLFLVCTVVTEGNFCGKTASNLGLSIESEKRQNREINFRKPVGVAATEITDYFTFKQGKTTQQGGREQELSCPFLTGNESENWETTFKKLVSEKKVTDNKALWVKISIVFGDATINVSDHSSVAYNYHTMISHRALIAKKLGLPEVILPSDVRNDLYINLVGGEFSRLDKRQDRNIEATVEVCDSEGNLVPDCLSGGVSVSNTISSRYCSVVYYHDGKPRWNEVVKVSVQADFFAGTHLRFTFRHRSRNDSKEKAAPWAMAFLKLVSDSDGTAVKDGSHDLIVYRIDKKYDPEKDCSYLKLPHLKIGQTPKQSNKQNGSTNSGLTFLPRDVFIVQTTLASTKLTQNEGLLSLLKWKSEPDQLSRNLYIFNQKVNGNEFVKFMPDVLDALFSILMEHQEFEEFDQKVFKSLVDVIHMITEDTRYQQFIPVLELYINENFYATLAYTRILIVLKEVAENATVRPKELTQTMKCLKYVFKFVVRSRTLCAQLNSGNGQEPFEQHLKDVLKSLVKLMFCKSQDLFQAQSYCLKHMVASVPDLATVYDAQGLAEILMQMLASLPQSHLSEQKIQTIREIVKSQLFSRADCRATILPRMVTIIKDFLENSDESAEFGKQLVAISTETMGDILEALHKCEPNFDDIWQICQTCLRTVIQSVANRKKGDTNIQAVVANMISIFRKMTPRHYDQYIERLNVEDPAGRSDLIDFVMEILGMFRDLLQNSVFPDDWNTMIMLQNSVIMKALEQVSHTIRDHLSSPFEYQAWSNFFQCAITFITQPSLQVEKFSETKKLKILGQYKDMRKEMGLEVRQMWFNLGQHKISFVPDMVGHFLEMTLIPETELRKAAIPIFFDMMQCEYYSSRLQTSSGEHIDTRRDSSMIKANFQRLENELITKLDTFVAEAGCGDEHYLFLFRSIMLSHCDSHTLIKEIGTKFVKMASRLMELLLEYRTISQQESKENQMSCCVHLLDFYHEIGREELYVKYLKKLAALHEQCSNWAEAGFTIMQYANLLKWSDEPLTYSWKRHSNCKTHKSLKENLYKDIIKDFEKGKMWENALKVCQELETLYGEVTFEYPKLADLYSTMSKFYNDIIKELRPQPEYFRVAFYGRGFPAFLQNKVFIYRGKGFERLPDFQTRMLDQFPNAELMTSLQPPTQAEMESPNQLMQINAVDPVMEERPSFQNKEIHPQIISYFKANEVHTFSYSRPYHKSKDKDNEFASLWIERTVLTTRSSFPGILQWFPVSQPPQVFELAPLDVAIETMQKANEDLKVLLTEHQNGNPPLNPLSMKLNGIIDAAVMGGTVNYERAFFTDKYLENNPGDAYKIEQLKDHIANQIPLLHLGIKIHALKTSEDLRPFHDRLEMMFKTMQTNVEANYGKRRCDIVLKRASNDSGTQSEGRNLSQIETQRSLVELRGSHRVQSQISVESTASSAHSGLNLTSTPKSKVFSVIGITRKKSNATKEDKSRTSFNNSTSLIRESSPDTSSTPPRGVNGGSKQDHQRLCVLPQGGSRPSSGQYITSTPNHSRSPSITSNRDSLQSTDGSGILLDPPPVPPKSRSDILTEEISISDIVVDHVAHLRKKKAPPPPPPTPPKKPPMKPFD